MCVSPFGSGPARHLSAGEVCRLAVQKELAVGYRHKSQPPVGSFQ